jgi:anti-sigma regulatory factor (Ser/Thr protein kinase)
MTAAALEHDASPVSGPEGFVPAALAAARAALAAGAIPVVLGRPDEIRTVRSACGDHSVVGIDLSVTGRNPGRLLPALRRVLDEHPGHRIVCIGLQFRAGTPAAVIEEFALHCRLLRLPDFARWNCQLVCAYDSVGLGPDLVELVETSHGPGDAQLAVDHALAAPLPARPAGTEELGVDRTTLSALRGFIRARTAAVGLADERADDLVYAVNEAVTNSICHGEGRARLSVWVEGRSVVCEVRDRGWIRDPLVGRASPAGDRTGGRGLWLVNHLCDFVQLRSSAAGTTLRMQVDL